MTFAVGASESMSRGAKVELILSLRQPSFWHRESPSERQGKILLFRRTFRDQY
jgi:hypothetical protein